MARSIFRASRVALLASLTAVFFCTKDYDPFVDITNAKAHVLSWSFSGSDSVPVYSTGMLVIGVADREQVDSFSLHAACNRFWQDTTVLRAPSGEIIGATPFSFKVSFFDTGVQTMTLNTWRVNGEKVTENISLRVKFPLNQGDVIGFFGKPLALSTPPVPDRDVFYQWDFGRGRVVKSPDDTALAVINGDTGLGTGTLLVTDLSGAHATPIALFSYSLFDTSRPKILCANANIHDDTLTTSDSILAFKAYIADYRNVAVDSCSVNGSPFDIAYQRTNMYVKIFRNMPAYARSKPPLRIDVFAMDNLGPNHESRRTFWAVFDPSAASTPGANISFIIPSSDSTTSGTRDLKIFGTADNFLGNSMTLRVTVNDSLYAAPCVITGSGGIWTWPVHLGSYVNSITVNAYGASTGSQPLASAHVVIAYDPTTQDIIKPLIWDIKVDGKNARAVSTQQDSVEIQVTAFDEWSGIQTLTINNTAVQPDTSGYRWRQMFGPVAHSVSGDTVVVRAVDRSQNVKDTSIVIFKNTLPTVVSGFAIPGSLCVDSTYTFHIATFDADNDPVSVIRLSAPATMSVSFDGSVSWKPGVSDIGTDTLKVQLYDGLQYSAPIMWPLHCVSCSKPAADVRFLTREKDFPSFLQAGVDTLRIRLRVDSAGAGAAGAVPAYSATFTDRNEVVTANDTSPLLVWAPAASDTGLRTLAVTVGDGTRNFDTIAPVLTIVPKNQFPCSLSSTFTGNITPTGMLDLYTRQIPETLFFAIRDLDNPLTEKYTVTISQHSMNSILALNKKDFFIVISPDSARILDTIRVRVRDMTGTSDSAAFIVRYSVPNPYPAWLHSQLLVLNTTPSGADVAGNVNDFPVLVRLTNSNFDFTQAQNNGSDIRFAKTNGVPCSYEMERWLPAQGVAEIWVKVDTVFGNNGTQSIKMYWGLRSTGSATVSASNGPATFDTLDGFQAVWHMAGAGTAQVTDATVNHYNGTPTALTTGASTLGMVGECQRFNGAGSYVTMPGTAASKLNFPEQGIYSVSAWVNTNVLDGTYRTIASKGDQQYSLQIMNAVNTWEFSECSAGGNYSTVNSQASTGTWNLVTGVRNGANEYLYVNGVCTDSVIGVIGGAIGRLTTSNFTLGKMPEMAAYFFNGMIDEVRVSNTALSADWNKLCFMNQKAVDALVVFK